MHYDISYKGLKEKEKKAKALSDIVDYLGREKFDESTEKLKAFGPNKDLFIFAVSFLGVQGFPAEVWFEYTYGAE